MVQRRLFRWGLFLIAVLSFLYFVFEDSDSLLALALFFISGGAWYRLVWRKMLALDSPNHR